MGKKNKKSSRLQKSVESVTSNEHISLEDEIIQHLQLLKEAGALVIGLNAVLRGLEKKSFCVVILISRKATSAMYHAVNWMCKSTGVIFLQLQDISSISLHSKVPVSTTYGIKTSALTERQEFQNLLEKINCVRSSPKFQKQNKKNKDDALNNNDCVMYENSSSENVSDYLRTENDNLSRENCLSDKKQYCVKESKSFIHAKHNKGNFTDNTKGSISLSRSKSKVKVTGTEMDFITLNKSEIDFPNYDIKSKEISLSIK